MADTSDKSSMNFKANPNYMGTLIGNAYQGDRTIHLGKRNEELYDNSIFTAKYTALTFVPKCVFLQFTRLCNIVFLFNVLLQFVPILSSLNPFVAIGPLGFVLLVSLIREGYEDRVRLS